MRHFFCLQDNSDKYRMGLFFDCALRQAQGTGIRICRTVIKCCNLGRGSLSLPKRTENEVRFFDCTLRQTQGTGIRICRTVIKCCNLGRGSQSLPKRTENEVRNSKIQKKWSHYLYGLFCQLFDLIISLSFNKNGYT